MQVLIDGNWADAADDRANQIRNKATGELIETTPYGRALDVMSGNTRERLHETTST